jgi:arsenate reductase
MAPNRKTTILFLCTGNACRSQMAEALLRFEGGERYEVLSAGSQPAGFVHGLAIDTMAAMHVPMVDAESKSWDEFRDCAVDAVITLCDNAAAETCPVWPGSPLTAHWSLPDPAYHPGSPQQRLDFCMTVATRLRDKIRGLVALDWSAPRASLQVALDRLGEI